jgi:hypothetical protein
LLRKEKAVDVKHTRPGHSFPEEYRTELLGTA